MKTPTELKSMVTIKDNEALIEALTQVAKDKGFVWNGQVNAGEIRPHKLFRYLVETHPEVTEALSQTEAEDEKEVEQDYCQQCNSEQPHKDLPTPTRDNPYESTWVCLTCEQKAQAEDEAILKAWQEEYQRLKEQGAGDSPEAAWERVNR